MPPTPVHQRPDLILRGGRVHTVDPADRIVDAVAIAGDRIVAAGAETEIDALAGPGTRVVQLRGRAVVPGFVDAHCHMAHYGHYRAGVDCKAPGITSIADIQRAVRERTAQAPPGAWVRAFGYDQTRLAERRHPTRFDLDAAAPDHPVLLTRTCGHIAVGNSAALARAGIDDATPDPPGGRYDRIDGRNAGVAYEEAQSPLAAAAAPTAAEQRDALARASDDWLAEGVTSVHDAAMSAPQIAALLDTVRDGAVRVRVYFTVAVSPTDTQHLAYLTGGLRTRFGDHRARLGPFKLFLDGSSSGPTAATRRPYASNPDDRGILRFPPDEAHRLVEQAHRAGFQVTAHAVGDRAIEVLLDAYERALAAQPRAGHRHRIEHCGICPPDLVARIARLGVVPAIQPAFFWEFGDGYLVNYGPERAAQMFPARSLLAAGVVVAGSSDAPVTAPQRARPLFGMQGAMTRRTAAGAVVGEDETVDLAAALRMFTYNGAYASFDERDKGSLEPGKLADLAVLDGPLADVPAQEIGERRVAATVLGGEVVFGALE